MSKSQKIGKNLLKFGRQKNAFSPTFPQLLMKSPINIDIGAPIFQKISWGFFDLGQKSQFQDFDSYISENA